MFRAEKLLEWGLGQDCRMLPAYTSKLYVDIYALCLQQRRQDVSVL